MSFFQTLVSIKNSFSRMHGDDFYCPMVSFYVEYGVYNIGVANGLFKGMTGVSGNSVS